ncbi:MAG: Glu/Leu/Phe/Val dehydrogenase [Bdellovibrionales bacterium]|nr:Glu/Leu/Phe/Val dehydrogenase [Bdellovibrionales bacterium]
MIIEDELTSAPLYRDVMRSLESSARIMNANKNVIERLRLPRRAIRVSIPVRMDDDRIQIFSGFRVQHNHTLGPFKGGIRYHPQVNMGEVAGLAALMTFKNSLLGLPLGGAKGGVQVDPAALSKSEIESLTRRFTSELSPFIGSDKDIPAPDVGTNEETMAWMLDTYALETGYSQMGIVTGKPIEIGGSQGRLSSTGLGLVHTMEKALEVKDTSIDRATIAIQGFGKVGLHACIEAHALGARVVAVSDISGAIYNPRGLNITDLIRYKDENRFIKDYPNAEPITNGELLELDVDVLAPCALDGVINEKNMHSIQAKIIAEGANGPTTFESSRYLNQKGVLVVPDILANGGGVVVSYFEWVQDVGWLFWTEKEVRTRLRNIMHGTFDKVWRLSEDPLFTDINKKNGKDLRLISMVSSLHRLEKAMKLRGQAW